MTVQTITFDPPPYSGEFSPGDTAVTYRFYHAITQITVTATGETGDTITYSGTDADTAKAGRQVDLSSSDVTLTITATDADSNTSTVTCTLAQDADPATEIGDVLGDIPGLGTVSEATVVASGAPTGNNTTFSTIMVGAFIDERTRQQWTEWETVARFTAESSSAQRSTAEARRQIIMLEAAEALAAASKDGDYQVVSASSVRGGSWTSSSYAEVVIRVVNMQPLQYT